MGIYASFQESNPGSHASDLLHTDFPSEKRFTITTNPSSGEGAFFASAAYEHLPGLKTICSFAFPNIETSKVELRCRHKYYGVCASMELTTKPIIDYSSVIANNVFSVGSNISFNTTTGIFTERELGLSFTLSDDQTVSLKVCNEGDTINISSYDTVCLATKTAAAAEFSHCISRNENILTVGIQHALDHSTLLKIRANNHGRLSAVVHRDLMNPRTRLSVFGDINTRAIHTNPKFGVAFSVMP